MGQIRDFIRSDFCTNFLWSVYFGSWGPNLDTRDLYYVSFLPRQWYLLNHRSEVNIIDYIAFWLRHQLISHAVRFVRGKYSINVLRLNSCVLTMSHLLIMLLHTAERVRLIDSYTFINKHRLAIIMDCNERFRLIFYWR